MSAYFLTIIFGAAFVGLVSRIIIEGYHLDRTDWLRLKPAWYYPLNGDGYDDYKSDETILVRADILAEIGGRPVVYSGLVTNVWFDLNGGLDMIFILNATRQWMYTADEESSLQFWKNLALRLPES
jgi:hypothetical protein